jgi:hypothetical protein
MNVAVTDSLPFMVIVVEFAVVLAISSEPLQPLKVHPVTGVAVRYATVPGV